MNKEALQYIKSKSTYRDFSSDRKINITVEEILSALDNLQTKLEGNPESGLSAFNLQFNDNWCRIEYFVKGEPRGIQDKGMNFKEALLKVVYELYQKFDKAAPSIRIRTDDSFLLED